MSLEQGRGGGTLAMRVEEREQILIYGGSFPLSICPARNTVIYLYFL